MSDPAPIDYSQPIECDVAIAGAGLGGLADLADQTLSGRPSV